MHTLPQSTSIESQESFFDTPTHDGEERGGGLVGNETLMGDQSSIASSWSAKSSNMVPMSSKMDTVVFLLEGEPERKGSANNEADIGQAQQCADVKWRQ